MKFLRDILICALLAVLILAAYCGALFIRTATETAKAVPGEIAQTRAALIGQMEALRVDALKEIDKQANGLRAELHGDVRLVNAQVFAITGQLNQRTGDALTRVDTALSILDKRTGEVTATAAGIRTDLKPTLDRSAALAKDAQDSLDDNYYDAQNLLQSSEVAVTQIAQTAETVNKAAPDQLAAAQKTAAAVAGITTDVHTMTTAMLKPKTFWGKVWAGITVASRFAGLF
jgi:ABC-type transporter Mla subunit MlaD